MEIYALHNGRGAIKAETIAVPLVRSDTWYVTRASLVDCSSS